MSPRKPKYTELTAQVAALKHALQFYADPTRYDGPNQRRTEPDHYTPPDQGYRRDVTRDGGLIARSALRELDAKRAQT